MNKKLANSIADDMEIAMEEIEKKYGVTFETHSGSFSSSRFDLKVSFTKQGDERLVFKQNAARFGIDPSIYNKTIRYNGETYVVKGINTRARKYPLIVESSDGTQMKFKWDNTVMNMII